MPSPIPFPADVKTWLRDTSSRVMSGFGGGVPCTDDP
jgi:hypothetical protein